MINRYPGTFFRAMLCAIVLVCFAPSVQAIIEAPHNKAAIGSCGNCHGQHLANSPFWGGAPDYNTFCWTRCHSNPSDRVSKGPAARTHSSSTTSSSRATWAYQCTACHYVHSQEQNNWDARNYFKNEIYLAAGYLTGPPVYDSGSGTTTFGVSAAPGKQISYKNANWTPTKLKQKTELNRGAVLIPNEFYPAYNYAVYDMAADGSTITLFGDLRNAGWVPLITMYPFRIIYGQYVKSKIDKHNTPTDTSDDPKTKFYDRSGRHSFADDETAVGTDADPTPDGVCQVCHEDTRHWSAATPAGDKHFTAWVCTECHNHEDGFKPSWPEHDLIVEKPGFCGSCHANSVFGLHGANDSTYANCDRCHQVNNNYEFTGTLPGVFLKDRLSSHTGKDKHLLSTTSRCDDCHHGQFSEHIAASGGKLHDKVVLGYDSNNDGTADQVLACDACHYPDAVQEHVTRRKFTCSVCHDRTGLGLPEVAAITAAINAGIAGTTVFCDDCHNDDHFLTDAGTSLVKEHHYTSYSRAGDCVKCHVVGPGERGPQRPPCWYCHGEGKPGDPQRAGVNKHDQGPVINAAGVDDFRACFSCHLAGGAGFVSGVTPPVVPMHGLPGTAPNYTNVYWPYGYYRDGANQWQVSVPLIPTATTPDIPANLEGDQARWLVYPGWHTLNYLGEKKKLPSSIYNDYTHPEVQDWARSGATAIRNTVGIDFQRQDYPTVPISMGGNYDIPSFDGTGTIGKPTGTGSVQVTISPAAAVTGGAQWRLDGGAWQNSGVTLAAVTDRPNHLVEFKPLPNWDEPAPQNVTITNLQTTALSGIAATYATCPEGVQFEIFRVGGGTSFDWTSPEQAETFLTSDWHGDPVACELWRRNNGTLEDVDGFRARTADDGNGCVLDKDGITPPGQYDLLLKAAGSSCFRNNDELELTVNVTAAGAPSPVGQAGGIIREPFLNSLALPSALYQDLLHLSGNLFVRLATDGALSTFTINDQGTVSAVLGSADLWASGASNGPSTRMVRVTDTLIALTYNTGAQGSGESHVMTVAISQDGTVITKKQDYRFHAGYYSLKPLIFPHQGNSNLFIVTWVGYASSTTTTGLLTIKINTAGVITELDRDLTLPNKGLNWQGNIVHVAGDKYAFAMAQDIYIFEVNDSGAITISSTPGSTYRYASDAYYADIIRLKGDIFALAYAKGSNGIDAGVLKTISISESGVISRTINSYLFDPCSAVNSKLIAISDNVVGVYYHQYQSCDGQSGVNLRTIEIADDGRIMVPPLDVMELTGGSYADSRKLLHVGGDIFAFLLYNDTSQGSTFNGVKTYEISHDPDTDGIADSADNCPAHANAGQDDVDGDGVGDTCDICPGFDDRLDADGDGIPNSCDVCPGHDDLVDSDGDGTADGCDPCPNDPDDDAGDLDGICIGSDYNSPKAGDNDNCPLIANSNQVDSDCDGAGDACSTPVYFRPGAPVLSPLSNKWATISFNDTMRGEDGYRIEGKSGACADNTNSLGPLVTIYRYDRFDSGIDPDGWLQSAVVQSGSTTTAPATLTDASGTAEVSWENGQVRLHNIVNDMAQPGAFNYAAIAVKKYAEVIGDRDFDIQVDYSLPYGAFFGDTYHADVRLSFYFPQTDGKNNEFYLERRAGHYVGAIVVNGVLEVDDLATSDLEGTLRLVRKNRELAAYVKVNGNWVLIKKHSQQQTANLAPTWAGIVQYAQRNESGGAELTALVDNFRFNTVGSVPVAVLDLPMDEASWQGTTSEIKDATAGNNHGTSHNGADTVEDLNRGMVGHFDGGDDYVEVAGTGILENVTDRSFTFAAWARPASVPPATDNINYTDHNYAIISRNGYHTELRYSHWKQFAFDTWNANATPQSYVAASTSTYNPGAWYHVAGVLDLSTNKVSLYVNGALAGTPVDFVGTPRDYGTIPYYIGMGRIDIGSTFYFDGELSGVKVFDRALSAAEVAALYNNRIEFVAKGLVQGTTYCTRVYPFKTDDCSNWANHAAQAQGTTFTNLEADATIAGIATAVSIKGGRALYVNMPYSSDRDADNTYTVEYKLSSSGTWTTHVSGAAHAASPYATRISGLTLFENYDVRVTYTDPDGVNGTAQQVIARVAIEPGISCLSILNNGGAAGDGVYWLDPDGNGSGAPFQAYCDMTTDGGGWTLAMKLDGSQTTFQYSANYWTTTNTLNPGSSGFDTTQAKLQSFNSVPFTQVRLGMRQYTNPADDIDWITANQAADSLVQLFNSGYVATYVGRASWLTLLEGLDTQLNCNKEGFNSEQTYSKMRIGLAMNAENDCNSCDRILGFGNQTSGHPWGAWAVVGGGYPGSNMVAYGWIMVR